MSAQPSSSPYDSQFFAYTSSISRISAGRVVPELRALFPDIRSVADFGCAQGVWLNAWVENGVADIQGVDGDYVERGALAIPADKFHAQDLNTAIDLGRRFDLAYSLEVAEHLRPECSEQFVASLVRHADVVIFSAAPPGQGGESHINERTFDDWRALFAAHGYSAYDCIRPRISEMAEVSFWYRYNVVLYVRDDVADTLAPEILATKVPEDAPIADVSPPLFKLRKFLIRLMPYALQNALARTKAALQGR